MKLTGRDATRFFDKPDTGGAGALLFGADAMQVSLKRRKLVDAIVGPNAGDEMRLTRLSGQELNRDPAALLDAVKAVGFFPGPRAVLVEGAGDGLAGCLTTTFSEWLPGDAQIVVTAGNLTPRSKLRKLFETSKTVFAIGIYSDPPGREEIVASLRKYGIEQVPHDVMVDLETLARTLDPGGFGQFLEKLALFKRGDSTPLTVRDVVDCAPVQPGAEAQALVNLAADGKADELAREFARLGPQGATATGLSIAAARHFRTLHAAALDPGGPDTALARARPPVFGPRRSRMAAQVRKLGVTKIETALVQIMDAELRLRSGRPTPGLALVERLFVRISRLNRR